MTIVQLNYIKANFKTMTAPELAENTGLKYEQVVNGMKFRGMKIKKSAATFDEYVKQPKQLRVMEVARMLCKGPGFIKDMASKENTSQRTIYRYIALLKTIGMDIRMDDRGRYFITECPFCKRSLKS